MTRPLVDAGVKFNKDEVIFVTFDKAGRLIWLEEGNEKAGMQHIIMKHENDFSSKHKISSSDLSHHIKDIIENGEIEYCRIVSKGNRDGYEILYSKNKSYYLLTGVGENGFLVTAYPIDSAEAQKLIERYKKNGKEKS